MLSRIEVPRGTKKYLGEVFHRSIPFVRKALRGGSNTTIARRSREAALKKGGVEYEKK